MVDELSQLRFISGTLSISVKMCLFAGGMWSSLHTDKAGTLGHIIKKVDEFARDAAVDSWRLVYITPLDVTATLRSIIVQLLLVHILSGSPDIHLEGVTLFSGPYFFPSPRWSLRPRTRINSSPL